MSFAITVADRCGPFARHECDTLAEAIAWKREHEDQWPDAVFLLRDAETGDITDEEHEAFYEPGVVR